MDDGWAEVDQENRLIREAIGKALRNAVSRAGLEEPDPARIEQMADYFLNQNLAHMALHRRHILRPQAKYQLQKIKNGKPPKSLNPVAADYLQLAAGDASIALEMMHRWKASAGKTKRKKWQARIAVSIADMAYRELIGRYGRSNVAGIAQGPFVQLVEDLFDALGISEDANAASQVEKFWKDNPL